MSTPSEFDSPASELDLDLHFLPAWAQKPASENRYAKFEGADEERGGRRGDRPGRRDDRRRDERRGGPRPRPEGKDRPAGERDRGPERRGFGRGRPSENREPREQAPLLELAVNFIPEEKGVESLARQIRLTGRAYPLFEIAQLILKKPERYHVQFSVIKKPDGTVAQPLFLCSLDDTLWLSEAEAINHVLTRHFGTFYQAERIPTDPPKGTYTFVAQCGMSGTILGPPNYHDYQTKLRKLHSERFSRVPFDVFKSRVKIVKDEATVKKWLEEQSFKTEYICLNLPEPLRLYSREEVDKHFREVHLPNIIRRVESHSLSGSASQQLPPPLRNLYRRAWEDQMRFPLKIVTALSQQFASHGLQFFKVNKTITHVAVARPRYLDLEQTPVSEGVKAIVDFINANPKTSRRKLLEALVPGAAAQINQTASAEPNAASAPPSPEIAAIISDLHWLIHQGHVIEFSNGTMELAKKPAPKPPKPEPQKSVEPAAPADPAPEAAAATEAEISSAVTEPDSASPTEPSRPDEPVQSSEIASGTATETAPGESESDTPIAPQEAPRTDQTQPVG
ncbi:MAG: hypothetical protein AB1813_15445 [Verrucomicrobiota bacterium]